MTTTPPRAGAPVPTGRLSRLARLGGMAGGVAGSMLVDGAKRVVRGERPAIGDLLLTPANARRVADRLASMRGAAMKMGQLLSMDAGELFPPELADIMARLRADADPMPARQLHGVLDAEWGVGWRDRFATWSDRPIAAASIGQVHRARTRDGRDLAVKVQYPGVRDSIDGDIDNLASLLRLSRVVPDTFDVAPLLAEAKRQLRDEADYLLEAEHLTRFGALLAGDPAFVVPVVQPDLTTPAVLAMSFIDGSPIETLTAASQTERDRVVTSLVELTLRELFEWNLIQTDPNFANFRYDLRARKIVLLDFGATRAMAADVADAHRAVARAALSGDRDEARRALLTARLFDPAAPPPYREAVLDMFELIAAALRKDAVFDFGDNGLTLALRDRGLALAAERKLYGLPPIDTLFLQRKAGGMFLLASRLKARVPVRAMLERHL
ncbi:ABC1 kinase family protein [uncultured Sphingomonas sp.]|uniref:ABC1 kinase family protein n=1 Tax=uncultured Sphingomonas sp. TaxID=158754 RepID=UPI0035C9D452